MTLSWHKQLETISANLLFRVVLLIATVKTGSSGEVALSNKDIDDSDFPVSSTTIAVVVSGQQEFILDSTCFSSH